MPDYPSMYSALLCLARQLITVAFTCAALSIALEAHAAPQVDWHSVGPDLELGRATLGGDTMLSAEIVFVRTALQRYRIQVVRAADYGKKNATVRTLARESRAVFGINANFFDERGAPLGLVMSRGTLLQRMHQGGSTLTGVFAVKRSGAQIVSRRSFDPASVLEAVQAGPRLLSNGERIADLRSTSAYARRAGVCIDREQRVLFFTVGAGLIGVTLDQLIEALLHPSVGCHSALNLDGGGSAQMFLGSTGSDVQLDVSELYIEGRDPVPVMLGLFAKR